MIKLLAVIVAALGLLALCMCMSLLFAYPVMWLTNWLFAPTLLIAVFGGPLTYWKAYGFSCFMTWLVKGSTSSAK